MAKRSPAATRRQTATAMVVPVIALGLFTRFLGAGLLADLAGGVFYAGLIYVLLVILRPRAARWSNAAIALSFCVAIELLQITSIPATLAAAYPPIRLVLGSTFVPLDLVAYAVGAALALGVDRAAGAVRSRIDSRS